MEENRKKNAQENEKVYYIFTRVYMCLGISLYTCLDMRACVCVCVLHKMLQILNVSANI